MSDTVETPKPRRLPYPVEWYPGCPCYACDSKTWTPWPGTNIRYRQRMSLCPNCGNKRCPGAANHANQCSDSNEPGQPGSLYGPPAPHDHTEYVEGCFRCDLSRLEG